MTSSAYKEREARLQEAKEAYLKAKKSQKKRGRGGRRQKRPVVKHFAEIFDVNYRSLLQRISGGNSRSTRSRTNERLDKAQYEAIFEYIDRLDQIGAPPTPNMLKATANEILKRNHQDSSIPPPTVGDNWPYRFIKKHPQYFKRRMQAMDPKRTDAERISDLRTWFGELDIIIEAHGIQDEDIYNMDETGFRLGHGKDENVISRYSRERVSIGSAFTRTLTTVIECIGVDGSVLPPFIIMTGRKNMVNWLVHLICKRFYIILI